MTQPGQFVIKMDPAYEVWLFLLLVSKQFNIILF